MSWNQFKSNVVRIWLPSFKTWWIQRIPQIVELRSNFDKRVQIQRWRNGWRNGQRCSRQRCSCSMKYECGRKTGNIIFMFQESEFYQEMKEWTTWVWVTSKIFWFLRTRRSLCTTWMMDILKSATEPSLKVEDMITGKAFTFCTRWETKRGLLSCSVYAVISTVLSLLLLMPRKVKLRWRRINLSRWPSFPETTIMRKELITMSQSCLKPLGLWHKQYNEDVFSKWWCIILEDHVSRCLGNKKVQYQRKSFRGIKWKKTS